MNRFETNLVWDFIKAMLSIVVGLHLMLTYSVLQGGF